LGSGVPVPQLGGLGNDQSVSESTQCLGDGLTYNENVLTLQTRNILVRTLDTLGNLTLVLVAG
jgi:hypothetical protein